MPLPTLVVENGIESTYEEFTALRGFTFRRKVKLWADEARTTPLNFAGLTFLIVLEDWIALNPAPLEKSGLVLDPTNSNITITLTESDTLAAPKDDQMWYLAVSDGTEKVCPVRGTITFDDP